MYSLCFSSPLRLKCLLLSLKLFAGLSPQQNQACLNLAHKLTVLDAGANHDNVDGDADVVLSGMRPDWSWSSLMTLFLALVKLGAWWMRQPLSFTLTRPSLPDINCIHNVC
jgi:hypothetical protein